MLGPVVRLQLQDVARIGLGVAVAGREESPSRQATLLLKMYQSIHHGNVEIAGGERLLRY